MSNLAYRVSELERKLNNIIRVGTVADTDEKTAKVRIDYGGENPTDWLPWVTRRAGKDREWWMPEKQEQVLLLSPVGDLAQGIVLPAIYQDLFPPNGNSEDVHRIDYQNGDFIEHNRSTGALTMSMKGQITLDCSKLRIKAEVEQTGGDMTSDGISAQKHIHGGVSPGSAKTKIPES